jgi:hypothetical protein
VLVSICGNVTAGLIEVGYPSLERNDDVAKGAKKQDAQPQGGNGLKRLEERLLKASLSKGFPAYVRTNFDRLSRILETNRGSEKWEELAKWAVEEGLTGGKELKPMTAKRTYEREVERRKKAAQKPKSQPAITVRAIQIFEEPKPVEAPTPPSDDAEARIEKLRRQMARRSGREI